EAVHRGDLAGVVADRTEDIVMFDVPPPHQGVRGLDAYRETWPPFFRWQAAGASFDIESLDITAGGCRLCLRPIALRHRARLRRQSQQPTATYARPAQAGRPVGRRARAP